MNKEDYAIDEKIYENYDGLKIKIIFSNLGRRYKKIGDNISLMLEKETVKLEDSLTAMIRITKENEEIDRKTEIKKIKQQAKKEVQQLEEVKNTKIIELEKEMAILKEMYEIKQKEKEKKTKLANEIIKFKEKMQLEDELEGKEEKTYENYDGLKIKIIFSNLGRRYKKIGDNLSIMLEKEMIKLEDSLTIMIRITKKK